MRIIGICEGTDAEKGLNNETIVETVVLLRDKKVNGHININLEVGKIGFD